MGCWPSKVPLVSTQPKILERFDSGRSRLDVCQVSVEMGCNVVRK